MLVRSGDRAILEAQAKAEPADDVLTEDFYTQLPQIRLTANPTSRQSQPKVPTDVTLDGNDVAALVECAILHPAPNMRYAVLAAIWSDPDSFREIFRFGLDAPPGFPELRKIVAEELAKRPSAAEPPSVRPARPADETLLPQMPLPAHLRDRERQ